MTGYVTCEYVWIDGQKPTPSLRSKVKVLNKWECDSIPQWGFDGSSTGQASGDNSDCVLKPVRFISDPFRDEGFIVLCEVLNSDGSPAVNNYRSKLSAVNIRTEKFEPLFGLEQEYVLYKDNSILGWPSMGYPSPQGPFYCGVGADKVFGREIANKHLDVCIKSGIKISGINAEVMPGQWEFQIGPYSPLEVSDYLWLSRYLLQRVAEEFGVVVSFDPKPVLGDWNGSGLHTNFSTNLMRMDDGYSSCVDMCSLLGHKFESCGFPKEYGYGFEERLTGSHETCSFKEFSFGVADRTSSIRIPLHVHKNKKGYIEDRRPCSNADPYRICSYLLEVLDGGEKQI